MEIQQGRALASDRLGFLRRTLLHPTLKRGGVCLMADDTFMTG
jgi:hypothetical protein